MQKQKVDNIIICPKCGTKHLANAKYCTKCGYIFVSNYKKIEKEEKKDIPKGEDKKSLPSATAVIESISKGIGNKIICPNCNTSFSSTLKRCPKCGLKIKS